MPRIMLRGIEKRYGGSTAASVRNLDLDINDGEFLCVLGPSGCGKTTTLRMIAGLEHPTAGEIQVGEQVFDSTKAGIFVPPEKRGMGFVFQSYALWPHLTVQDNIDFGLALRRMDRKARQTAAGEVMEKLGIAQYRDRYPSDLSGGQQQRVALARMLVMQPNVILMDEPLSNLDAKLRLEMRAELKKIHLESGSTIIFVTHDQWEAMTLATTIAVMREGTLQQLDSPENIYNWPCNRFVAEFVGSPPMNIIELGSGADSALSVSLRTYLDGAGLGPCQGSAGIRPESIRLGNFSEAVSATSYSGQATATGIMPTGGNWIIELTVAGEKLFATTNIPPRIQVGEQTGFLVDQADLHLFHADGNRLPS